MKKSLKLNKKYSFIFLTILLLSKNSFQDQCNEGVKNCRDCQPGGNKCKECLQETLILTKEGRCIECKEVEGCQMEQCDHYGCKVCQDGYLRDKNENLGFFYCRAENNEKLRAALWICGVVVILVIIFLLVWFMSKKKETEEDLYDKLLSRDLSVKSGDKSLDSL